jgi:hypothetical protein
VDWEGLIMLEDSVGQVAHNSLDCEGSVTSQDFEGRVMH